MAGRQRSARWQRLEDEALLDMRLCDLGLKLEGTALEARVAGLHSELEAVGLNFRPYVWLSTDWFTPDGLTGFAAPFYLAHPRLLRLERRQMLEVEGGGLAQCQRILRHEAAHALDNAYGLRRRAEFRRVFGPSGQPYRQTYAADPRSRKFVLNLPGWYAQSHPLEDFAETFAVWLQPGSRWRRGYARWPALCKLEYVDGLMAELRAERPRLRTRRHEQSLPQLRTTLGEHYQQKRRRYGGGGALHGLALRQLFSDEKRYRRRESAAVFLTRLRVPLVRRISVFTGQHRYNVDQALLETIQVCKELGLRLSRSERETHLDVVSLLTARTMTFTSGGRPRFTR